MVPHAVLHLLATLDARLSRQTFQAQSTAGASTTRQDGGLQQSGRKYKVEAEGGCSSVHVINKDGRGCS